MKSDFSWDPDLLKKINILEYDSSFDDKFSLTNPDNDITVRPLSRHDYDKGFPHLLSQLTTVGTVSKEDFINRFDSMKSAGCYYTLVIEDSLANNGNGKIVGTGTLEIEEKFIHSCAVRGRIEDVVVDDDYRGRKFGKIILGTLTAMSKELKCYKTSLECKEENIDFYQMFGYKQDPEKFMQLRFRN